MQLLLGQLHAPFAYQQTKAGTAQGNAEGGTRPTGRGAGQQGSDRARAALPHSAAWRGAAPHTSLPRLPAARAAAHPSPFAPRSRLPLVPLEGLVPHRHQLCSTSCLTSRRPLLRAEELPAARAPLG